MTTTTVEVTWTETIRKSATLTIPTALQHDLGELARVIDTDLANIDDAECTDYAVLERDIEDATPIRQGPEAGRGVGTECGQTHT